MFSSSDVIFVKTVKTNTRESRPIPAAANTSFYPAHIYMKSDYVDAVSEVTSGHIPVPIHAHDFYEIIYFRNSIGAEYLIGSDRYRIQKGDIILTAPGVAHCPFLPDPMPEPYLRYCLRLSADFIHQVTRMHMGEDTPYTPESFLLRTSGTRWEFLGELFHQSVVESEEQKTGWELALVGSTIQLLIHLHRAQMAQANAPMKAETPQLVDHVLEYIENHLREKITLADVAHHFYVSQSTITQTFRNKLGLSFYRCVTQRRLIAARRLIESGLSMDQVSEQVGFQDYSSFFRAFKQEYGVSPRQFRTMQTK